MAWIQFNTIAIACMLIWTAGIILVYSSSKKTGMALLSTGILLLLYFVIYLWVTLDRPPMRTLGETRLWYSLLLPISGLAIHLRWKYKWILTYSFSMAALFLIINMVKPETHQKELMPALQSVWFVPHVVVYMLSYAVLAVSSLISIKALLFRGENRTSEYLEIADTTVYIGFAFLTMGLLFGAYWAKQAWGHYWTWDPKETWALITWLMYLIYIHMRFHRPRYTQTALWILALSFVFLLVCWFGINYLPAAQNSIHVYSN